MTNKTVDALTFYAEQWEQSVDAERTATGWQGSVGDMEPSSELLADKGERARAALSALPHAGVSECDPDACKAHIEAFMHRALKAEASLSSQHAEAVPVGWQLVPIDPTDAMLAAGRGSAVPATQSIGAIYRAMLAASSAKKQTDVRA